MNLDGLQDGTLQENSIGEIFNIVTDPAVGAAKKKHKPHATIPLG